MSMMQEVIRVPLSARKIRRLYDFLSHIYDFVTRYEISPKKEALKIANVQEGSRVLEVGFGTGRILLEFARKVGNTGEAYGLDLSRKMTDRARRLIERNDLSERTSFIIGNAGNLPFLDSAFDMVFSSYMFDLIDTPAIPGILAELKRVLKPTGRLVLVSLSKGPRWYESMKAYEFLYRLSPSLLGGCRPVFLEPYLEKMGFKDVKRRLMHAGRLMTTEIVWADKASGSS